MKLQDTDAYKAIKREMGKSVGYYKSCVKCKRCDHSINLGKLDKKICEFCGEYVFKDDKTEFLYKLNKLR